MLSCRRSWAARDCCRRHGRSSRTRRRPASATPAGWPLRARRHAHCDRECQLGWRQRPNAANSLSSISKSDCCGQNPAAIHQSRGNPPQRLGPQATKAPTCAPPLADCPYWQFRAIPYSAAPASPLHITLELRGSFTPLSPLPARDGQIYRLFSASMCNARRKSAGFAKIPARPGYDRPTENPMPS